MRKMMIGGAMTLALALAPATALAQDEMSDDDMMAMVPHPSHIHVGVCPAPGDVVAPLSDTGVVGNDAEGAATHVHVDVGVTNVALGLSDILAADHAIVVHASADDMGTYLVCGNIGGHDVNGSFLVGLGPVADSGYAGMAWLTDNGDGTTDVTVTVARAGSADMMMDDDMSDDMGDGEDMDDSEDMDG